MSEEEIIHEGTISRDYRKKDSFKTGLILAIINVGVFLLWNILSLVSLQIAANSTNPYDVKKALSLQEQRLGFAPGIIMILAVVDIVILLLNYIYLTAYIANFSYIITKNSVLIKFGVLEKNNITIPFSRIQNIGIAQGVFDRLFKTYTFNLETAGGSGKVRRMYTQAGPKTIGVRPEGYIPGLKDPSILESILAKMMTQYSQLPSGVEERFIKPEEMAFDNFISQYLSKITDGNELDSNLKNMKEYAGFSTVELAERIGCPVNTIIYLEEGTYSPSVELGRRIAKVLKCKIEDIFVLK